MTQKKDVRTSIPIELFQEYLNGKVKRYGTQEMLATRIGVTPRRVREFLSGRKCDAKNYGAPIIKVNISLADKWATNLGDHLMDIDPSLYE